MSSSNAAAYRRLSSSAMTATVKRPAMAENARGAKAAGPTAAQQAKKRVALGNITNVANAGERAGSGKVAAPAGNARFNSTPAKKGSLASVRNASANRGSAVKPASTKPAPVMSRHDCSTQKESVPPPKRFNSAPVKKESLASVRNASANRSSAVKPASTKPAPVIPRNDCSTQKESVPPPKRFSSTPVNKESLATVRNASANRGSAVKPASTKPAPVISRHDYSTQKESVPPPKRYNSTPVKKGSLASVRNASVNRSSAVKSASTKPAPVISSHDFSTQKESVPLRKSFSSAPVKKGSLASVRNASANRGSAVKPASNKPAPVISSHDFSTQKESVPRPKRFSSTPVNKGSLASLRNASANRGSAVKPASNKPAPVISRHDCSTQKESVPPPKVPILVPNVVPAIVPCSSFVSPRHSADSISIDETMSTCDSMKSPDFEYINNGDSLLDSLQRQVNENLHISEDRDAEGTKWKKDAPAPMEIDNICDVDDNYDDPQLCATLASDIYMHLREAETRKRPSTDFLETIQKDVNPSMRAILIDWLVEVAEEYRLVPDTLYLTVNYIDRYLSGNEINRQRLQLLGVACMLIAAKYEEICAPQVEEFCYITDDTYFKDEVLDMEASVLNYLKFEMTAPTAKCFLRRFVRAAQVCDEDPELHLEFLANYVAELSLLEYSLISYPPSLVAASAIFLSKFILQPTKHPWNSTLAHYTQYKPSELCDCVKALHRLFSVGPGSNLPAIREKYSQEKYKFVAKKQCPPSVPTKFFQDVTCWTISQE